jgi:hypothetical protein
MLDELVAWGNASKELRVEEAVTTSPSATESLNESK